MKIRANVRKIEDETSRVKAFADITLENCCMLRGMSVRENDKGELFVSYPQKPVFENGQPKKHENGKQVYTDIYYARSKEANDAIKALVLEAYNSENGYAYINPAKGEAVNAYIEPHLHSCNDERVKASGFLEIGGYMKVTDVFVNLYQKQTGESFLGVSYPHYQGSDEVYRNYVEPLEDGKLWDSKTKEEKDYNFRASVEGLMKKQTLGFHPELSELIKPSVQEKIDEAKKLSENTSGKTGEKSEMEIDV